jgi:hypothetical protein
VLNEVALVGLLVGPVVVERADSASGAPRDLGGLDLREDRAD